MIKATPQTRIIAKSIDLLIVFLLGALLPRFIGPLIGFAYSLFADALKIGPLKHQSVGKHLLKITVKNAMTKEPIGFKESLLRNIPIGVATFFAIIPIWGWIVLPIIGLPLIAMEIYLLFKMSSRERLGDVMADTIVVKEKENDPKEDHSKQSSDAQKVSEVSSLEPQEKSNPNRKKASSDEESQNKAKERSKNKQVKTQKQEKENTKSKKNPKEKRDKTEKDNKTKR